MCYVEPNPDIAGVGIIISIFVQSASVICVAWWIWYLTSRLPTGLFKRVHNELRKSSARRHEFCGFIWAAIHDLAHQPHLHLDDKVKQKRINIIKAMQETIVSLSDIQTFFGIAFLVAATSQATRLNLYHMALVDQVSWLPSQAHQLALAQAFWHNTPHLRIRILLILLYVLIFCMFEGMYFWRIVAAEEADDDCRDAATTKPWVIVNIILTLWSYWPVIALYRTRQKHAAAMQTAASADLEAQKHEETETPEKVNKQPPRRVAVKVIRLFITLFNSRVVALITMTIFYGLQISESKDTRDSYDHGNESEWGFGQVASMMVLAASSFEFYKSFAGYRASKKESNSADNIPDTQYLPPSLFLYWAHGDVVVEAAEQQ